MVITVWRPHVPCKRDRRLQWLQKMNTDLHAQKHFPLYITVSVYTIFTNWWIIRIKTSLTKHVLNKLINHEDE